MSDELTELPEGWIWTNVKDITSVITGKTPSTSNEAFWDGDIPFVTPSQICPSGSMLPPNRTLTKVGAEQARIIPANSTLAVCIGTVGKIGLLDRPSVINQQLNALVPSQRVSAEFLYYWSQYFLRSWIIENASATVNAAILNKSRLETAPVVLPPLNEQKRIVAKIEELRDRHQRAKQALETIPELCDRFRQSVLAAAFRGDLTADCREQNPDVESASVLLERIRERRWTESNSDKKKESLKDIYFYEEEYKLEPIPKGWQYFTLEKLCHSFQYGTSAKSLSEGEVPVLRMGNLQSGEIDWADLVYTSDKDEITKYRLNPGDVLFNRTNSPELVGKTSIYRGERDAIFAGYLIKIGNYAELDSEYLNYCLNTSYARDYCWKVKTDGVSQSNINAQKLAKFEIPFCSVQEQQEIVRQIHCLFKAIAQVEQQYQNLESHLNHLNQSILAKAFRGELVDQDPNDEPASVLLDRIRAEREKAQAGKSAKGRGRGSKASKGAAEQMTLPDAE